MPEAQTLRGRQAEAARNDHRVLEAAREVFAQHGLEAPITAVAERAGVGVGSLYRRYGGKEELLQRVCVLALEENLAAARAALAGDDPWAGLTAYVRSCVGFSAGAFGGVAGHVDVTDEMSRLAAEVLGCIDRLVGRAREAGALRADATTVDVVWLIEHFSRARPVEGWPSVRDRQLSISLAGLRSGAGEVLEAPAPTLADYQARWQRR